MRIIAGKYRGRKLLPPKDDAIRPTGDRVKETVFNVIQFRVGGSRVLDLFSGSGALGIEALSRGADEVVFVDNSLSAVNLIKRNLERVEGKHSVRHCDYKDALIAQSGKFDIIFIDPPYQSGLGERAVDLILANGLLSDGGVIVFEHSSDIAFAVDDEKINVKTKKIGAATVDFLERTNG